MLLARLRESWEDRPERKPPRCRCRLRWSGTDSSQLWHAEELHKPCISTDTLIDFLEPQRCGDTKRKSEKGSRREIEQVLGARAHCRFRCTGKQCDVCLTRLTFEARLCEGLTDRFQIALRRD